MPAALGTRCAIDEVDLTAHARVEFLANRVGANLTCEVNLNGRVYGGHLGLLCNDERVVGVGNVLHQDFGVVVQKVVYFLRTHYESGDYLVGIEFLVRAVDNPASYQIEYAVGEHLGVNAQMFMVGERCQNGVRNSADTHLQAGAVLDQLGAMCTNDLLDFARLAHLGNRQRTVVGYHIVDLVDADQSVAKGARYIL